MKKLLSISLAILVAILMSNCSKEQKPEQVVKNFFEHLSKGEFDKARELSTGDIKQTVEEMEKAVKESPEKQSELVVEIKDIKCEIKEEGKKATCTFKGKSKRDEDFIDAKAELTKEDGKWKIVEID